VLVLVSLMAASRGPRRCAAAKQKSNQHFLVPGNGGVAAKGTAKAIHLACFVFVCIFQLFLYVFIVQLYVSYV